MATLDQIIGVLERKEEALGRIKSEDEELVEFAAKDRAED
jgi:hypothetical protein